MRDFLPRFNNQFRVPAQQPQIAYRSLDPSICLERFLCFKRLRQVARDNTVKYQWRTLQLLPGQDRPSYAGVKVEVLEQSDGQLMVHYGGEVISHQEAPPRSGALRASNGALAPTPEMAQVVRNLSQHGLSRCKCSGWRPWSQRSLSARMKTRTSGRRLRHPERLPRASRPCGRQCTTPDCRVSPSEASPRNWVFPGTRSASTLIPGTTRQPNSQTVTPISSSPQCWRSFPLSTYPDIFAGQRHY